MLRLSVNVNKVATLRNARGGELPSLLRAVDVIVAQGCRSITVHPRADERHIRPEDVRSIAQHLEDLPEEVELNIEGDPRPDWIDLVREARPTQATLVPVTPGEITSQAGWPTSTDLKELGAALQSFKDLGIRTSVFVEARPEAIDWAKQSGADRVELYTEPYAKQFVKNSPERVAEVLEPYKAAAQKATALGMGVNAGHDLDLDNLPAFVELAKEPYGLREVSIGHALISEALFEGLGSVVRRYMKVVELGLLLLVFSLSGCKAEKPPAPQTKPAVQAKAKAGEQKQNWNAEQEPAILTFAGERGRFRDTGKIEDVPEEARGLVRVALLDEAKKPPSGKVWVSNLNQKGEDGLYALELIARDDFELFALGMGRSSKVSLPEGLEPPKQVAPGEKVIVYSTVWCGVCKKVKSYLKQKGVDFVDKDIEKDRSAAAELQAKAKKAGVSTGSVPIIDVSGQLMVGFDRRRLDEMLANR